MSLSIGEINNDLSVADLQKTAGHGTCARETRIDYQGQLFFHCAGFMRRYGVMRYCAKLAIPFEQ